MQAYYTPSALVRSLDLIDVGVSRVMLPQPRPRLSRAIFVVDTVNIHRQGIMDIAEPIASQKFTRRHDHDNIANAS